MGKLSSYNIKMKGIEYRLDGSQIQHLSLLFLERHANKVDIDHLTQRTIRDMCWVTLNGLGQDALRTSLNPKTVHNRYNLLEHFRGLMDIAPMWDPTTAEVQNAQAQSPGN